ncbi:hypothetical protein CC1G_15310 [Coprinopsis cinerea okayama7|uniref:SAP domain-containing protein n=1 Tax=Coprinopsis cinerea (strain Okayama-7 / 130 / ATCC MYA-4618 / FGSC 9003) TaxID=240176 RepID=D6RPY9_COPC7|nr:hypothetical protein CC1G_15310 [Coprinopsis cinerea okayama7\|eukprot:XP_002910403.1 hypothetical protein CC1G_15310 [Coprinopsis cinerea okayama7\
MAPVAFTGALAPKKKSELQDIATALNISDQGTKDDLQTRIKKHLDNNPELEEDAKFAGLYARGRRRGSVAPTGLKAPPSTASEKPRSSLRIAPLDPIRESTPPHDLRDVSMALKQPVFSSPPSTATPQASPAKSVASPAAPITAMADNEGSPSVLPSLPPSPAKSIIEVISKPQQIIPAVQEKLVTQEIIHNGHEYLEATREFLSNSQNLWTLTALFEFGYIWYTVIPWAYFAIPLSPKPDGLSLSIPYAPLAAFQTSAFWTVLLHWVIPTLIVPAFAGHLISFTPPPPPPQHRTTSTTVDFAADGTFDASQSASAPQQPRTSLPSPPPFDSLTAAIIRFAVAYAYPYSKLAAQEHVYGLDVIGREWRLFNAGVVLMLAFAEAVLGVAPRSVVRTLHKEKDIVTGEEGAVVVRGGGRLSEEVD